MIAIVLTPNSKFIMALLDRFATVFFQSVDSQASAIVHCVALEMGTVGFFTAQIPGDKFVIAGAQIDMVLRLGRLYKVRLDRAHAIGLVQASLATLAGPTLAAEGANQVVKYIPGNGNISNTAVAASITEAIGWICIKWFKDGSWVKQTV